MKKSNVTGGEIFCLCTSLAAFRIFTTLPVIFTRISGTGAPLSALLAGILAIAFVWLHYKGHNFFKFTESTLFKYIFSISALAHLAVSALFTLTQFSYFAKITAFPTTPIWFVSLLFVIAAGFGAMTGIPPLLRVCRYTIPVFVGVVLLLILSVLWNSHPTNLFPVLGNGATATFGKGLVGILLFSDLSLLLLFDQPTENKNKIRRSAIWGTALGVLVCFLTVVAYTAKIPYPISKVGQFPFYLLMKEVSYGRFFQRVDAIVLLVSALWGMLSLCLQLCLTTKIFSDTFGITSKSAVIFPLCFALFFYSLNGAVSLLSILSYSAAIFVLMLILCNKKSRILILLLPVFLSGCYDQKEIDETAYIVALGIDKGKDAEYSYTFQFSAPLAISGEGEGGEKPAKQEENGEGKNSTVRNLTINAPDFYVAKNMINNFMSKNIDMSHLKLIVFSAGVDENSLETHSQLLLREREIRPHTAIAVAAESASGYLENVNPELEANTSKYYELMSLRSNNVYAPTKRLHDFVDELTADNSSTALPIAISGSKTNQFPADSSVPQWVSAQHSTVSADHSVLYGMAIFKNGKLHSAMDGDSAMIYNILTQSIEDCTITLKDKYAPENTVSFRLVIPQKAHYKIRTETKQITVIQDLQAEFSGGALPKGYLSFDELYSYAKSVLTDRISEYFIDLSREKSADIMGIKNCLRKNFTTFDQWSAFDWDGFYKNAKFNIKLNFI